jgi:hypothetical protein
VGVRRRGHHGDRPESPACSGRAPEDLLHAIEKLIPEARERAILRLNTLLRRKHRGLELAAKTARSEISIRKGEAGCDVERS